jgi:tetratricopeptide (TPR) repeat protein
MKAQLERAQAQNGLINQAIDAMNAREWQKAIAPLKQLIANDPDRYEFYQSLGEAQLNLAQYDEAIQSFEKGIQVANGNATSAVPNPANDPVKKKARIVSMLVNEGNAFVKLRKAGEAIGAFTRATEIEPASGVAQFNLCAMLFNAQKIDAALATCEKSIALEPQRPATYFIKGKLLVTRAKRDKNRKDQTSAAAALKKYLELAPEGPHVPEARELLTQIGVAGSANPGTAK